MIFKLNQLIILTKIISIIQYFFIPNSIILMQKRRGESFNKKISQVHKRKKVSSNQNIFFKNFSKMFKKPFSNFPQLTKVFLLLNKVLLSVNLGHQYYLKFVVDILKIMNLIQLSKLSLNYYHINFKIKQMINICDKTVILYLCIYIDFQTRYYNQQYIMIYLVDQLILFCLFNQNTFCLI